MTDPTPVLKVLAALPVADVDRAVEFWARFLGRPADERPESGLVEWLADGGTLQLVTDGERAGGGLVTLHVVDVAATRAHLAEVGIAMETAGGQAVGCGRVTDPDGNVVTVVQA